MIRTQLCPSGELEDKNWWHLDVAILMIVMVASYYAVTIHMDGRRGEVQDLVAKKQKWEASYASQAPMIEKFQTLNEEMSLLNQKIGALKKITTSKLDKVKPLVALDQLQTLWIDGIWYEELQYSADGAVVIKGAGHDGLLIGEYMLGVRETMNPETRNNDVRTQIGFDGLRLKVAKLNEQPDEMFKDVQSRMQFELSGDHREKPVAAQPGLSMGPPPRSLKRVGF